MIEDKKSHARGLYFQTQLSQQEIADRVGVNRKTLYLWINEEKWQEARLAAAQSPTILLHQYYQQLININEFIATRTDCPFPTPKEADVIRKISSVIKQLSTKVNLGTMVEVFNLFTDDFLRQGYSQQEAIAVRKYMDDFLKRRFQVHKKHTSTGLKYAQDDQIVAEYKEWEATYPSPSKPNEETPHAPQNEKNNTPAETPKTEDKTQKINEVAQTTNAPSVPHSPTVAAAPVTNLLTEPSDPPTLQTLLSRRHTTRSPWRYIHRCRHPTTPRYTPIHTRVSNPNNSLCTTPIPPCLPRHSGHQTHPPKPLVAC
jgi:DNA-binding XRE family transcriptional regulator